MKTVIAALLTLTVLVGCVRSPEEQQRYDARRAAAAAVHARAEDPAKVQAFLANTTTKSYGPHGTQIEYLAADGRTYLWYPGNRLGVPGRWRIEKKRWGTAMCFLYGRNSYNSLTGQSGGAWECDLAAYYILGRDEIVAGNPLRLSLRIPYVLPKREDVSISAVMANAGFGGLKSVNKAPASVPPAAK